MPRVTRLISNAITDVYLRDPLVGTLVFSIPIYIIPGDIARKIGVPVAATNGYAIILNEDFIESPYMADKAYITRLLGIILAHEALHIILAHPLRARSIMKKLGIDKIFEALRQIDPDTGSKLAKMITEVLRGIFNTVGDLYVDHIVKAMYGKDEYDDIVSSPIELKNGETVRLVHIEAITIQDPETNWKIRIDGNNLFEYSYEEVILMMLKRKGKGGSQQGNVVKVIANNISGCGCQSGQQNQQPGSQAASTQQGRNKGAGRSGGKVLRRIIVESKVGATYRNEEIIFREDDVNMYSEAERYNDLVPNDVWEQVKDKARRVWDGYPKIVEKLKKLYETNDINEMRRILRDIANELKRVDTVLRNAGPWRGGVGHSDSIFRRIIDSLLDIDADLTASIRRALDSSGDAFIMRVPSAVPPPPSPPSRFMLNVIPLPRGSVYVLVDTSGSVTDAMLAEFMKVLEKLLIKYRIRNLNVYLWSDVVTDVFKKVKTTIHVEKIKNKITTTCGTYLSSALAKVLADAKSRAAIFILSDFELGGDDVEKSIQLLRALKSRGHMIYLVYDKSNYNSEVVEKLKRYADNTLGITTVSLIPV